MRQLPGTIEQALLISTAISNSPFLRCTGKNARLCGDDSLYLRVYQVLGNSQVRIQNPSKQRHRSSFILPFHWLTDYREFQFKVKGISMSTFTEEGISPPPLLSSYSCLQQSHDILYPLLLLLPPPFLNKMLRCWRVVATYLTTPYIWVNTSRNMPYQMAPT